MGRGGSFLTMMASACLESSSDTARRKPLAEELEVFGVGIFAAAQARHSVWLFLLFLGFYRARLTSRTLSYPPSSHLPPFSLRERKGEEGGDAEERSARFPLNLIVAKIAGTQLLQIQRRLFSCTLKHALG